MRRIGKVAYYAAIIAAATALSWLFAGGYPDPRGFYP